MKVAIFSDTHLGFDEKGERSQESFENLEKAIKMSIDAGADFAVLCGDVFDEPVPTHNTLFRAMQSFGEMRQGKCGVDLALKKGAEQKKIEVNGFPILTIHGNHEFRGKETRTALDVLNLSGLLVYFHAGCVEVTKKEEKAFVFGLGAVPEKKALEVMRHWNPVAQKNAANLLLVHQSFKEFMVVDDEMVATLSLDDLPKGFELVIDGHLHWSSQHRLGETTFLLAGSTIATSIKKLEAQKPKGVFFYDTISKKLDFSPFALQRKMFYHKFFFRGADCDEVLDKCKQALEDGCSNGNGLKPLVRLNLKGTLKKGLSSGDVDVAPLLSEYSSRAIISLSRNFSQDSFRKKISELRELHASKSSVASIGLEILEKNLLETDFGSEVDAQRLFELLSAGEFDSALRLFSEK
ncbi:MAG: metallophosphoesterase [archaeon]|nr:metallophosphoesterase [archaeon]